MQSPAASFLGDVVGAAEVLAGKATRPSGVRVSGDTLTVRLTKPAPDFLNRIAMPFFCAVPENLPINPNGVNTPPGAGPYYVSSKEVNKRIVLQKNPYYGGSRPQRWDTSRRGRHGGADELPAGAKRRGRPRPVRTPAGGAHRADQDIRNQQEPVLRLPVELDQLLRAQHVPRPLQGPEGTAGGGVRGNRPALTNLAGLNAGQAERADPAARDPRVPRREHLPARPSEHRQGEGAPRRQDREDRHVHDERPHRHQRPGRWSRRTSPRSASTSR